MSSMINEIKIYGIVLGVLLCLDLPMILFINNASYKTLFDNINGSNKVTTLTSILASIASYSILAFAIYRFGVKEKSYLNAIFLGLIIFGVYDFTNLSTIAKYDVTTGLIDIGWGTTLSLLVTAISLFIAGMLVHEEGSLETTTDFL